MRVLLIYPRYQWQEHGQFQEPLGILYIASVLIENGFEVSFLDLSFEKNLGQLEGEVQKADVVGMTSSTVLFSRAVYFLKKIKALRPELDVILGGPHATAEPEGALKAGFDYLVIGEGEETILELLSALAEKKGTDNIPGVWSKKGEEIFRGGAREFIKDIDSIPFPARQFIDYPGYFSKGLLQIGICVARGCPYQCRFCKPMQDLLFGRRIRKRGPGSVVEEIGQSMALTGRNFFLFRDDCLASLGKGWFLEFRKELEQRSLKIAFSGQTRVNEIDEGLLLEMKACGLVGLAFGAESGSQKIVDYYDKRFKVEDSIRAFELCHKHGIGTHCFIILGAPEETQEDLAQTIELVKRVKPESITISRLTPAPGTYLHKETIEQGILGSVDFEEWDFYKNQSPIKLKYLSEKDLIKAENQLRELVPASRLYPRVNINKCSF